MQTCVILCALQEEVDDDDKDPDPMLHDYITSVQQQRGRGDCGILTLYCLQHMVKYLILSLTRK